MRDSFYVVGSAHGAVRWILLLTVAMGFVPASPGQISKSAADAGRVAEPNPPDVLDLVLVAEGGGSATLEAVVKPAVDSAAELEIAEPGGAKLQSGAQTKRFTLQRGGAQSRERVQVNVSDGKPRTVKAVLRLLGTDGKPWLIVQRELTLNQPQAEAAVAPRVPVVQTLPDGSKVVEYISQQEAIARGLPATGKPAPSTPRPAEAGPQQR